MTCRYMITPLSITTKDKCCNYIYWTKVETYILPNNNNIYKWRSIFNLTHTQKISSKYYHSAFYATLNIKLRTFQYKIIRRILPTNIRLKRVGIKHNDICDFCKNVVETYEYLFFKINAELQTKYWMTCRVVVSKFNLDKWIKC
jgi:hypothetical protein